MKMSHPLAGFALAGLLLASAAIASPSMHTLHLPMVAKNADSATVPTPLPATSTPTATAVPAATPTRTATPAPPITVEYRPNADSSLEELVILRGAEHKFDPWAQASGGVGQITAAWYIDTDNVAESTEMDPAPLALAPGEYHPRVELRDQAGQLVVVNLPKVVKVGAPTCPRWRYGLNALLPKNIGIYVTDELQERAISMIAALPVDVVRIPFFWDALEPAPGRFDFAEYDSLVSRLRARDLDIIAGVGWTPWWAARERPPPWTGTDYLPDDPSNLSRFLYALATHYGDQIVAYEVYNEPNHSVSCHSCDARSYLQVLRVGYLTLKHIDPDKCVVMAGLAENGIDSIDAGTIPNYLASLLGAGAAEYTDAINVHPYFYAWSTDPLANLLERLGATRQVVRAHGVDTMPLWVTETGWPNGEGGVSMEGQARLLSLVFGSSQLEGTPLLWYRFEDGNTEQEPYNWFTNSGLVTWSLVPKPSYYAFQALGAQEPVRSRVRRSGRQLDLR